MVDHTCNHRTLGGLRWVDHKVKGLKEARIKAKDDVMTISHQIANTNKEK